MKKNFLIILWGDEMLNLIVLLKQNSNSKMLQICNALDLKINYNTEKGMGYSNECYDERIYLDCVSKVKEQYTEEELKVVPYSVTGMCVITYYPQSALRHILESVINCDDTLFIDDDNGYIGLATEYYCNYT